VLSGIGVGLESAVYTTVIIGAAVYLAFLLGGGSVALSLFLVALAGCGLLTTVGVIVAMDTFGPVSDNAQGIAEMSGDVHGDGVQVLTELDAVGNTTKAITKGIAIATAVLAATALFGSYTDAWQTELAKIAERDKLNDFPNEFVKSTFDLQIVTPSTLVGLLIGASVVFLFSGLAINAVTRAAGPSFTRCVASSASTPGSWTTPRSRSTAAWWTSVPRTRCASSQRLVFWPHSCPSWLASVSVSARSPASLPARSALAP